MPRPIVIGHHLIWTVYGTWLPNDPRGSGSRTIASDLIAELGELHYGRKSVQPTSVVIRAFYIHAKNRLVHPVLRFDQSSIPTIAAGFAEAIEEHRYTCYACAILRDHVHLLIRKHKHQAEAMIDNLKHSSRTHLLESRFAPEHHPVWTLGGWKVFQDHPDDMHRTIGYINLNPSKAGLPSQRWPFVKSYDGWPLHPGHSPNSPYVRRLRQLRRN